MSEIRFGVVIPQGWSYDLPKAAETVDVQQHHHQQEQQQTKNQLATTEWEFSKNISKTVDHSSSGFDSIYTYDHFLPYYAPNNKNDFFECFTLLSSLAAITSKVKLGQVVTCNTYRNPALLAKMLSTLDIISNGRIELGIGAGWYEEEYRQYGYDFPTTVMRIEQLDEAISIIKAMWSKQNPSFKGKYYSIKDAICNPKPLQEPYPTIMIGGSGEKYLLKVVAKHADIYNHPCGSVELLKRKISKLKEHCAAIGRNPKEIECSILVSCLVAKDNNINYILNQRKKQVHGMQQVREAENASLLGLPENIISGLNKYVNIGITHFIMDFIGLSEDTIKLFDSKVIKKL
ncbi:MAG TPA: TIGR03560 family F420-dependent LLM class oxidoreductase [Nitrososphaeraceae archaeon]|nr:TIGR03560 family F420-dependent LLM class oxidoreductase [Nitrososphaeraceae archaeon]